MNPITAAGYGLLLLFRCLLRDRHRRFNCLLFRLFLHRLLCREFSRDAFILFIRRRLRPLVRLRRHLIEILVERAITALTHRPFIDQVRRELSRSAIGVAVCRGVFHGHEEREDLRARQRFLEILVGVIGLALSLANVLLLHLACLATGGLLLCRRFDWSLVTFL